MRTLNKKTSATKSLFGFVERWLGLFLFLCSIFSYANCGHHNEFNVNGEVILFDEELAINNESNRIEINNSVIIYDKVGNVRKKRSSESNDNYGHGILHKKKFSAQGHSFVKKCNLPKINKTCICNLPLGRESLSSLYEKDKSLVVCMQDYAAKHNKKPVFNFNGLKCFTKKVINSFYAFRFTSNFLFFQIFCRPPTWI